MTTYDIAVQFERGYIADPYWPEIAKVSRRPTAARRWRNIFARPA